MRLLLSRGARRALELEPPPDRAIAAPSTAAAGGTLSESFREARILAQRLMPLLPHGTPKVSAGDLFAFGRLEQALRAYLDRFLKERDRDVLVRALAELDRRFGREAIDRLLDAFADEFLLERSDPIVTESKPAPDPGLASARRQELLGELLIFSIAHSNPAGADIGHLLHFGALVAAADYEPVIAALNELLDKTPGLHGDDTSLIRGLRRPITAAPNSVAEQLRWLLANWSALSAELEPELVAALDLITEEEAPRFAPGPGPAAAPAFDRQEDGEVHYGADRSWMSRLVLAAKNTHVWLHQLSGSYGREIVRLDQIPDAELRTLAQRGITGLWLIGLWERSRASQRIKQLCGNPEAAGSAYSLLGYRIAADLGGDDALAELGDRARRFGIRLSADMVPNHTGIDSDWMIEHPDWFLSVPVCPFPAYTFNGPDLSPDPRIGIFLEDHYFNRSDAAVVFKRVDHQTGAVRFVYHGNDGTGMPWNDTAQLDYLNPDTRDAVIRTIMDVARRFPIIRFDAAMTLAKRHIQRLWHPEPGKAGAIPSRAEHTMSSSAFDAHMPREFWREVVDRAESEAPDTLLLAEAFWLMEGYFVRTLGLHRVYNSAFMNMLRDCDNRGYRRLVRESLEFDPEILRRYVNFLSNPDEQTAVEQFGDGDRYFGACTLLATMPGLPMLAHGQVEGLTERYGMEYRRAYVDESANQGLVERHERQIFPLLRERERFAGVDRFALHDFVDAGGAVAEDVLAFSHGGDGDTTIVVFNNQPAAVRGVLRLDRDLGISGAADRVCAFRDRLSGRHFLRVARAIHDLGLELELAGWATVVLVDFREAADQDGTYRRLGRHLGLGGTPSLEEARRQMHVEDARTALGDVLATLSVATPLSGPAVLAVEERLEELDRHLARALGPASAPAAAPGGLAAWLEAISRLAAVEQALSWPRTERMLAALDRLLIGVEKDADARFALAAFALLGYLDARWGGRALSRLEPGQAASRVLRTRAVSRERAVALTALLELASAERWLETGPPPGRAEASLIVARWRESEIGASLLGYDRDSDTVVSALVDRFLTWRATAAALSWLVGAGDWQPATGTPDSAAAFLPRCAEAVVGWCDVLERLRQALDDAGLRIEPVIERLRGDGQYVIPSAARNPETSG